MASDYSNASAIKSREEVRQGLNSLFPRLWRYCLALTGSRERADDLVQAACLRVLDKADRFQAGIGLDRWMFRLTQRLWLNELRSDAVRRGQGLLPVEKIDLPDQKSDPRANLFARQVLSEMLKLPEAQRVTVLLVYMEGYSYREASETLDIPVGTVMSRLSAARAKLNEALGEGKREAG